MRGRLHRDRLISHSQVAWSSQIIGRVYSPEVL